MRLNIKNIGKIHDSTIEFNGITVIAGENSTGKSTFSKVLYCIFNAFYDTETAILNERVNHIRRIVNALGGLRRRKLGIPPNHLIKEFITEIKSKNNEEFYENDIRNFLLNVLNFSGEEETNGTFENMIKDIKRSLLTTDEEIQTIIISGYFGDEFEEQINHVNKPQSKGEILLTIKNKNINVNIENNKCNKFEDNVGILHDAIYIDTPFIIDGISTYSRSINYNHRENLCYRFFYKEQSDNSIIQKAIIDQKIEKIFTYIAPTINGEFEKEEGELKFREKKLEKSIPLYNVSAGIKIFLIIKRLLELGEIKERGILIFDEPEIHLHPGWQLKFAEILVLLQKEFNLTILLTTHSPYFISAIEVYGENHDIKNRINFYLAESQEDSSDVKPVTNNVKAIYKQLAEPFQKLEDIEYED